MNGQTTIAPKLNALWHPRYIRCANNDWLTVADATLLVSKVAVAEE